MRMVVQPAHSLSYPTLPYPPLFLVLFPCKCKGGLFLPSKATPKNRQQPEEVNPRNDTQSRTRAPSPSPFGAMIMKPLTSPVPVPVPVMKKRDRNANACLLLERHKIKPRPFPFERFPDNRCFPPPSVSYHLVIVHTGEQCYASLTLTPPSWTGRWDRCRCPHLQHTAPGNLWACH